MTARVKKIQKIRVLLVDDHQFVRTGVKVLINAQPDMTVVGEAADGRQALAQAKALQPQIVVMDLSMPQMRGLQATEQIKQCAPDTQVVILTFQEDEAVLQQLVVAGAAGFVLKRSPSEELLRAIRTVAAGGVCYDPPLAEKNLLRQLGRFMPTGLPRNFQLSPQEEKVLRLIAWGKSNKEVASELEVSVKSVETYKARLTQKLRLRSRTDIVRFALRQGWLQED